MPESEFKQKVGNSTAFFSFGETDLSYGFKLYDSLLIQKAARIRYEDIPFSRYYEHEGSIFSRNLLKGIILLLVLFALFCGAGFLYEEGRGKAAVFFAILGCGSIIWVPIMRLVMPVGGLRTVFPAGRTPVIVLQDGQHDRVVEEIMRRRRDILRATAGSVDFLNPPAREFMKFRRFLEEGIVSEQECAEALLKLRAGHQIDGDSSPVMAS